MDSLDKISFSRLESMVESIKKQPHLKDRLDEVEISFEYLVGSLFPSILTNVRDEINNAYTQGYLQGYKECQNETKGHD